MEAAGLVARGSSPEDGRGVVATMTDKGYALLDARRAAPRRRASARNLVDLVDREDFAAARPGLRTRSATTCVAAHPEMSADIRLTPTPLGRAQSRVRRRCVTRCGRAASTPRRSILFSS